MGCAPSVQIPKEATHRRDHIRKVNEHDRDPRKQLHLSSLELDTTASGKISSPLTPAIWDLKRVPNCSEVGTPSRRQSFSRSVSTQHLPSPGERNRFKSTSSRGHFGVIPSWSQKREISHTDNTRVTQLRSRSFASISPAGSSSSNSHIVTPPPSPLFRSSTTSSVPMRRGQMREHRHEMLESTGVSGNNFTTVITRTRRQPSRTGGCLEGY